MAHKFERGRPVTSECDLPLPGGQAVAFDWIESAQRGSVPYCAAHRAGLRCVWVHGRTAEQLGDGAYVAVKLPLIIFITLIVNGLLNGLLGLVLGSGIGFRKSVSFCSPALPSWR